MNTNQSAHNYPNILRLSPIFAGLSLAILIPGIISLLLFGLKPSIDFTGGSLLEIKINSDQILTDSQIRNQAGNDLGINSIQTTDSNSFIIRSQPIDRQQSEAFQQRIQSLLLTSATQSATLDNPEDTIDEATASATTTKEIEELRFETVGPTLGRELLIKTFTAIILAATTIMLYVAIRFNNLKYGVCAILAMLHDTLIVLGSFSILGHFFSVEVDTLFVTAVLTALAFSIHDTIVLYDRIREKSKQKGSFTYEQLVNASVLETLSRSVNNSMTTILMLLALVLLGGETIRWFVTALLIGIIAGTYSSPFVAAPLLLLWEKYVSQKPSRSK